MWPYLVFTAISYLQAQYQQIQNFPNHGWRHGNTNTWQHQNSIISTLLSKFAKTQANFIHQLRCVHIWEFCSCHLDFFRTSTTKEIIFRKKIVSCGILRSSKGKCLFCFWQIGTVTRKLTFYGVAWYQQEWLKPLRGLPPREGACIEVTAPGHEALNSVVL